MQHQSTVNKVILVGNIIKEPRIHREENYTTLHFTLLTSEEIKSKGQSIKHEELHQVRISPQHTNAELLKKGQVVYLQGRIQTKQFVDEDGIKRFKTEIFADSIDVLSAQPEVVLAK